MKLSTSLLVIYSILLTGVSISLAAPPIPFADQAQSLFSSQLEDLAKKFEYGQQAMVDLVDEGLLKSKKNLDRWFEAGREWIKQDGLLYEYISNPTFSEYNLRATEPKLCDPAVKQYSGYLDVADDKHLFFWFFESRTSPEDAPLILWLNGGPGCSSSTGLLFELGPCRVADNGHNTTFNPNSWTNNANIIFLDQPVNVGFSYATDGTTVNSSPIAAKDVYAFLQLFLGRYKKYARLPFHLAAESYGGTYAPNFASVIHKENQALRAKSELAASRIHINLASIVLANGLTDPYVQYGSVADYACDGPYPVYPDPEGPQCYSLRSKIPTCQRLIQNCYKYNSRFTCLPAVLYCNAQVMAPFIQTGLNLYDVRKKCDRSPDKDGELCYKQMGWIETWMNTPSNKIAIGVDPSREFAACNMEVNKAFTMNGDGMRNSALLLPELIEAGIRLLVYAGNADLMCNFIGNERWVEQLDTSFAAEFAQAKHIPWVTMQSGRVAGEVRSAGGDGFTAGNITYVNVHEAGHMVPYDQPEAALDLITRWILDVPLSFNPHEEMDSLLAGELSLPPF